MSAITKRVGLSVVLVFSAASQALAQTDLPKSQPNLLQIYREELKLGHAADHEKVEAGWPAAYEKAKSPYYYLAFVSLTGAQEAWFISPFDSHQAIADWMKFERDNAVLAAELARLQRADAEHLNGWRSIQAVARKELSHGDFPDTSKQRFWEISTFRIRPGHEADFAAAAKAFAGAVTRAGADTGFRVYQVIAGMPTPTYFVFSSLTSYGAFDKMMADDETIMKAMTEADQKVFKKFFDEAVISSDTQRFELNPQMSYVSAEIRASDPAFWMPKKPVMKKTTTTDAPKPKGPGSR